MMCSHPVCCRHVEQCLLIAVSGRGCMQIPCEFLNVLAMFKTSKLRKTQVCYILYMHRQTLGLCAPTRCRPHYKKKKKKLPPVKNTRIVCPNCRCILMLVPQVARIVQQSNSSFRSVLYFQSACWRCLFNLTCCQDFSMANTFVATKLYIELIKG